MIKVLQSLYFGNFIAQTPLTAESGWRWIVKTLVELECYAKKICASRERKKSCLISCHYLMIEKQAAGQEYKIGEHSSWRAIHSVISNPKQRSLGLLPELWGEQLFAFVLIFCLHIQELSGLCRLGDSHKLYSLSDGKKNSNIPLCQQGNGYCTGTHTDNAGSCPVALQDKCREQWHGFLQASWFLNKKHDNAMAAGYLATQFLIKRWKSHTLSWFV